MLPMLMRIRTVRFIMSVATSLGMERLSLTALYSELLTSGQVELMIRMMHFNFS